MVSFESKTQLKFFDDLEDVLIYASYQKDYCIYAEVAPHVNLVLLDNGYESEKDSLFLHSISEAMDWAKQWNEHTGSNRKWLDKVDKARKSNGTDR